MILLCFLGGTISYNLTRSQKLFSMLLINLKNIIQSITKVNKGNATFILDMSLSWRKMMELFSEKSTYPALTEPHSLETFIIWIRQNSWLTHGVSSWILISSLKSLLRHFYGWPWGSTDWCTSWGGDFPRRPETSHLRNWRSWWENSLGRTSHSSRFSEALREINVYEYRCFVRMLNHLLSFSSKWWCTIVSSREFLSCTGLLDNMPFNIS